MPTVQIKDVPADVHRVVRQRAAAKGQSQQEYLLALLTQHARTSTVEELLERARHRSGGDVPLEFAAELIRADRDSR
jgi:plasmid stability protein